MNFFSRLFRAKRDVNPTTTRERARLGMSMPGETAAMAGNRLGVLVN